MMATIRYGDEEKRIRMTTTELASKRIGGGATKDAGVAATRGTARAAETFLFSVASRSRGGAWR